MPSGRSSLAWGLVGGLSFVVLLQGFELLTGLRVDPLVKVGVAAAVAVVAGLLTSVLEPRLAARKGSP